MAYHFNPMKALQAVGVLMREVPSASMTRIRLLKLLYIADRESMKETGRPITGDRVVAMAQGPVLSGIYDCIKGACWAIPEWEHFFVSVGVMVCMRESPAVGELSRRDIATLQRVSKERADEDEWAIVDETHTFAEWKKNDPGQSSKPIPFEDVLDAVGKGPQAERILQEAKGHAELARLLEGP